jgi:hypothetical protein
LKGAPTPATTASPSAGSTRLKNLPQLCGRDFWTSEHEGADFIDDLGRSYDAVGDIKASENWNESKFLNSIRLHLLKSNDFTVIDLTGFTREQIAAVNRYLATLDDKQLAKILRIGF